MTLRRWIVALGVAVGLTGGAAAADKKLVYYGWDVRDSAWVAAHWREMELEPFDGVAVSVAIDRAAWAQGRTDTTNQLGWNVFGTRAFAPDDVALALADLRAARWTRFTENFLPVCPSADAELRGFAWDDDARWQVVLANWRVVVGLARQAGMRGILLDPEGYGARLFAPAGGSTAALRPLVRRRGRELMAAAQEVYPDLTILTLQGYSLALQDPKDYALYPAFLDGMLEAAGRSTRVVDGFEAGFGYRTGAEFAGGRRVIRDEGRTLSDVPELYPRTVAVGFGLWLDRGGPAHWNAAAPDRNYFTPATLETALRSALAASDRYVWLYSQAPRPFADGGLPDAYRAAISAARGG
jgi:hypothetical protein